MLQTYRHTDMLTDRPSDEAGPRGAFAPKKCRVTEISIKMFVPPPRVSEKWGIFGNPKLFCFYSYCRDLLSYTNSPSNKVKRTF